MKLFERYYRGKFAEENAKEVANLEAKKASDPVRKYLGITPMNTDPEAIVVSVTEENAMKVPVVFGGMKVLRESIAMLPLITYERLAGDQRRRADTIPEYELFKTSINYTTTSFEWRMALVKKMIMKGHAFTWLIRSLDGRVLAMRFIDHEQFKISGGMVTLTLKDTIQTMTLPYSDVMHLKWMTDDGINGQGLIDYAPEAIGFLIATERYGKNFFTQGIPFVVLLHPGELGETGAANLIASWKRKQQNKGREPVVLEEGMTIQTIEVPNDEAQFLESRNFQIQEIARFFRVTPHKLQDLSRATFSNVVELNQSFVIDSLMPITTNIQQRIQLDVFRDRPQFFTEFLFDDLLRGSIKDRYEAYRIGIQNRIITIDEARHIENRNDLTDEQIEKMSLILGAPNTGGAENRTQPNQPSGREASEN